MISFASGDRRIVLVSSLPFEVTDFLVCYYLILAVWSFCFVSMTWRMAMDCLM